MPRHYIRPLLHSPPAVQDMISREVLLLDLSSIVSLASVNTPLLYAIQSLIKHPFPARKNLLALGLKDYEIIDVLRGVQPEKEHIRYNTVFSLSWKRAACHSLTDYFISIYVVCERNIVTAIEASPGARKASGGNGTAKGSESVIMEARSYWPHSELSQSLGEYPFLLLTIDASADRLPDSFTGGRFPDRILSLVKSLRTNSLTLDQKGCRALLMRQSTCTGRKPAFWAKPRK
ncbi:Dynamin-B [Fusarium oxysporum f. sp. albedinis]|nr:Dynamin-B [Fusarium oxysporum f. sp. albedinis]